MAGLGLGFFIGGLAAIAAIATVILLAIWTYRDAESRGMIPILWTALVILVPSFVGLIVYLVVRTSNNKVKCSNCNTMVNSNIKFCSNCGVELTPIAIDTDKQNEFKKSQTKVLISIFVSLGITIICGVMMIVAFIVGALSIADKAIDYTQNIDVNEITQDVSDALADLDKALGNDDYNIKVDDDEVVITNELGRNIIRIDGDSGEVNINGAELRKYIKDIDGTEISDEDIERIENQLNRSIKDNIITEENNSDSESASESASEE